MKKSVRFKMPAYDFSILSCSLNIFSQETENFKWFLFISRQFSPQQYFQHSISMCRNILMNIPWNWLTTQSQHCLVLCILWIHVLFIAGNPLDIEWSRQAVSQPLHCKVYTFSGCVKNFGLKSFFPNEQIVKLYILTQLRSSLIQHLQYCTHRLLPNWASLVFRTVSVRKCGRKQESGLLHKEYGWLQKRTFCEVLHTSLKMSNWPLFSAVTI